MAIRFPFVPKGDKFFDLFEEGAANLVNIAKLFRELVEKWEGVEDKAKEIGELEHRGDDITHRIMANLHSTFFTPLDREDIALLCQSMDDVVDFIQAAADAMLLYNIERPTASAVELANIIVDAAIEIERVMPSLRRHAELRKMLSHCVELNRLENEGDRVKRKALGDLFDNRTEIADMIKWREIYEHMESATDRCEDVANVLEGVALKHA
jgi:predicted phosphate transport protein (TIGR00153 family)